MNNDYNDYQITVLRKAIEEVGTATKVADIVGCHKSFITRVLKKEKRLSPMMCVKLAKKFPFIEIQKMGELFSKEITNWMIIKSLDTD